MICPEKHKCSNTNHKDVDASVFCPSCNKFFCESCDKALHEVIFTDHQPTPISGIMFGSTIITEKCDIANHNNNLLNYYCKDHNVPCCGMCLCPTDGIGKHSRCQTVPLKDMEQYMKTTLGNIIKELECEIINTEISFEKINNFHAKNEEAKNEVVNQVRECFNEIRRAVNSRENEIITNIEELWEKEASCEDLIVAGTEYPGKAREVIEAAKNAEQHLNSIQLSEMARNYGLVMNTTNELIKFGNDVNETTLKDFEVKFKPEKDGVDAFIGEIRKFGDVFVKPKFTISVAASPNNKYALEGPNKSIIRKINTGMWDCTVVGNGTIPPNAEVKWNVKVVSTKNGHIMVGVAPSDVNLNANNNYNKCGWYFYCNDLALYSGPPHNYNGSRQYGQGKNLKNGDIVGVTMNTRNGELSFSVNGTNLGLAYSNIPLDKPLVPAIEFRNRSDSVEILLD